MNRLVVVEDDLNYFRHLFNHISNNVKDVKLADIFVNSDELIENLFKYSYEDIVLIDLDIKEIDSKDLLSCLKNIQTHLPYIIVISKNIELINLAKSYRYIKKPLYFSSVSDVISKIIQPQTVNHISELVHKELKCFNLKTSTIGYTYLSDSIKLALHNRDLLHDTKNLLFKEVGVIYNKSSKQIKWGVEKCIESIYKTTDLQTINTYFYLNDKEKITPKVFISHVVNSLSDKIS